jgi:protein phosphatase
LGPHPEVEVDIEGLFSVQLGDTFLLCSDGLTGRISDGEIGAITQHLEPEEAVNFLIDLANLRGGSDNVTVIVTRILSEELNATGEVRDSPSEELGETHPVWWFVAAGGLATTLVSYRYGQYLVSALGGVAFLLAALGAAGQWMRQSKHHASSTFTGAPYATAATEVNRAFTDSICETLEMTLESLLPEFPNLANVEDKINHIRSEVDSSNATSVCQELASISRLLREQL